MGAAVNSLLNILVRAASVSERSENLRKNHRSLTVAALKNIFFNRLLNEKPGISSAADPGLVIFARSQPPAWERRNGPVSGRLR